MGNPIASAITHLTLKQEERHTWLFRLAEQARRAREEDRARGIIWSDEK